MVATFRGSDTHPKEVFLYHMAGADGQGGSSYIDHVILRDRDASTGWTAAAGSVRAERRYVCQNWRADVSVILTDTGSLVEWAKYSSYGVPFGLPAGDTDADGDWDAADSTAISSSLGYDVRHDTTLDGVVSAADVAHANAITGGYQTLGRGRLSSTGVAFRQPGDTREFAFNSSGGGATSTGFSATNAATAGQVGTMTQFYPNFRADLEYFVQDTGFEAGFLRMTMTITNLTNSQLSINTFNTMDIDLGGTAGGDSATLSAPNLIRITDATTPWIGEYSGVNANGWAVAPFGGSSVTSLMTNTAVNNFTNTGLPFGPGDITAGFQWEFSIDPGQSVSVVATFSVVPAPGTLALLGFGGLLAARRRR
ncbi:PEP-CTERM sorting domain-containing protein [Leptolyngbya sp. 15MV]|nr:PEP-CTERM sorting domain-containing protein [Leptolyngbya sp. 15MV]